MSKTLYRINSKCSHSMTQNRKKYLIKWDLSQKENQFINYN